MQIIPEGKRAWFRFGIRWVCIAVFLAAGSIYTTAMPGKPYSGDFLPLSENELVIRNNLKRHIQTLAADIGERNLWNHNALEASAGYITDTLEDLGYGVGFQSYSVHGRTVKNIEAEITGADLPDEIVLAGAHYDTIRGTPGANDNGSGVAAVLEIARLMRKESPSRTIRFVFFVNEEPPFFHTDEMGSAVYASRSRQEQENIVAMISLETIGYYSDEPHSQHYPFPLSLFYPDTGNFLGFVGNISSRRLVKTAIRVFRDSADFPTEGIAAPSWLPGIDWSDQWSFWEEGYKGIMVTDTALYRYRHYHKTEDSPDKISFDKLSRVTKGIASVVRNLANDRTVRKRQLSAGN